MLRRILQNLLTNAVQYTERGGIKLAARRRGPIVRIEVWDTGPGIAAADQEMIFEEFQRGPIPDRLSIGGFGLGLSIVQRMAEALGHPLGLVLAHRPRHALLHHGAVRRDRRQHRGAHAAGVVQCDLRIDRRQGARHRQRRGRARGHAVSARALGVRGRAGARSRPSSIASSPPARRPTSCSPTTISIAAPAALLPSNGCGPRSPIQSCRPSSSRRTIPATVADKVRAGRLRAAPEAGEAGRAARAHAPPRARPLGCRAR